MACEKIWVIVAYTIVQSIVFLIGNILLVLEYSGEAPSGFNASYGYVTDEGSYLCPASNTTSLILTPNIFYIIQLVFIALHAFWIISCLIIIFQLCNKPKSAGYYVMWIVTAILVFIFDVGVGIVVSIDYGNYGENDGCINIGLPIFCFRGFFPIVLNFIAIILVAMMMRKPKEGKKSKSIATVADSQTNASRDSLHPSPMAQMAITRVSEEGLPTRGVVAELEQKQRQTPDLYSYPYSQGQNPSQDYGSPDSQPRGHRPVVRPPYVNVAYTPETEQQYYSQQQNSSYQQQHPYGNPNFQRPGYGQDETVIYEDENEYEDFDSVPPPAYPPRGHRRQSNKHQQQPVIPKTDYARNEEPKNAHKDDSDKAAKAPATASYEMRPFSYVNPSFRPADHLDIESMKTNQVDIVKTLDQEIQNLKEQELVSSSSEAESIIRTAIVKTFLSESGRMKKASVEEGERKKKKKKKKMDPIVENAKSDDSSSDDDAPPPPPKPKTKVLEARV